MALPQVVQQQLDQADALMAQQAQQAQPQSPQSPQSPPAEPGIEVVTDPTKLGTPPTAPATAPQADAARQEPAPATPAPASPTTPDPWEHRFRTVEGMMRAQNAQAQQAQAQAQARAEQAEREAALLRQQLAAKAEAAKPTKPAVDARDAEQFGDATMDMVTRYIAQSAEAMRREVGTVLGTLMQRVQALEGGTAGAAKRTDQLLETTFWTTLKQLVPDYEGVNASERWRQWLAEVDVLTGAERQKLLDAAQQALDAPRVARFFTAFKATMPAPASAALAGQVSPATSGAFAAPTAAAPVQVVTQSAVQQFYNDLARGRYRGREAEATRIEAGINQAIAEGRVR